MSLSNNIFDALPLQVRTDRHWAAEAVKYFDRFLIDHAAAEKKASGMAISMISHYPDKKYLVEKMTELAIEELNHFKEVIKLLHQRNLILGADKKDAYVIAMRAHMRQGSEVYLMDRLIIAAIIEARGAERFALVHDALQDSALRRFYKAISISEKRHFTLFHSLAMHYFAPPSVEQRFDELLAAEAQIVQQLPIQAALH